MKINIGCGNKGIPGFVGIDKYPCDAVEVMADIEAGLPLLSDSADEAYIDNVIEHIADLPGFMREIHRVCRHDAKVTIITPHFTSLASWRDPTHIHHLSYFSMDHFARPQVAHYMGGGFRVGRKSLSFPRGFGVIGQLIFRLSPLLYEQKWCFIFRAYTLQVEMTVVKE
jgi:SAM-dependent methyltransferase